MAIHQQSPLEASHTADAIRARLARGSNQSYLRDFVYGSVDGLVTTFAVISGVAGAGLASGDVLVLGFANLLADGFSMAMGNYLGMRAEIETREKLRRQEYLHIQLVPEGEREEIRQLFAKRGFSDAQLEAIVEVITGDERRWVETMLREELGLPASDPVPWQAALTTFSAFVALGMLPMLVYLWNWLFERQITDPFAVCSVVTGAAFFALGAFKSRFVARSWLRAGLETLVVGGGAAAVAYAVGVALGGLA
jgi:VIT1/CCC1 family predicted Fe2+/Mn2+ transporter